MYSQSNFIKSHTILLLFLLVLGSMLVYANSPAKATVAQTLSTAAPTVDATQALTTFSSKAFKLPMSVSFGADWKVRYDLPGKFDIENQHDFGLSFYIVTNSKLADPIDGHLIPFPEDFLSWIKSNPDFGAIKAAPVRVAGIDGLRIDATPIWKSTTSKLKLFLSLSGDVSANLHGQPDGENIVTDPEQWRFILLNNVNGEQMLIILIAGNGHNFEDAVEQTQPVLDSLAVTTTLSPKIFMLPMSVSFGTEWSVEEEYPDVLTLMNDGLDVDTAFIIVKDVKIADPMNSFSEVPFPNDFVNWIQAHGLFPVVETQPVVVAGFQGIQINTNATADCGVRRDWLFLSRTAWNCRKGEYYRFIYLDDVNGEHILIMNTGGDNLSAEHFKAGVEASQKILDTVSFGK